MRYFAITNEENTLFWNGILPTVMAGAKGKPSYRTLTWYPKLGQEPTKWARESTAVQRLYHYSGLRAIRPDLPKLVLAEYVNKPQLVRTSEFDPTPLDLVVMKLSISFGSILSMDYRKCFDRLSRDHIYAVRSNLRIKTIRSHIPDAHIGSSYLFATEADMVMLKMLNGISTSYDISSCVL